MRAGVLFGALLAFYGGAHAFAQAASDPNRPQIDLTISGSAVRQIPIAIPALQSPSAALASGNAQAGETIRSVVSADLLYSGLFNVLPPSLYETVTSAPGRIPLRDFAAIGAQGVVSATLSTDASGIVVEGLLFDSKSEALITGKRYRGAASLARDIAHRIANDVLIAYTGRAGVSLSRLVMVGKVSGAKEIFVMDYDGSDIKQLTKNGTLNMSPAWSPDGRRLAFVSYRQGNPRLYIYSGEDGSLHDSTPPGSELCVAPEWAPDGRSIAFSSSSSGDSEIFVLDVATGRSKQITFSRGSDTAPAWSPSARELAFTSDRSGSPQVYLMDAEGANIRRLSFEGDYNDSAAWSPSGDRIAYASRKDGRFDILVHDVRSGRTSRLTQNSGNNENPRWSPDGRHIVFSSNRRGSYRIYTMDADGNRQESIDTPFEATMPDWSH
ncbi:MAG TPA: Tol-Pal system beta propeller repeat protein TolB [Candidatus Polarisedimenticolia bacterium]|nr:Tol-Pal system beta propeller repeat protein TolB [Candidatus Polarisedimenticolia bacterium]